VSDVLPDDGTPERDEIEEIRAKLLERGYEMHLDKQATGWFAPLLRDNLLGPSSSPYGFGDTPLAAARDACISGRRRSTATSRIRTIDR
jgi:hypothetical protein